MNIRIAIMCLSYLVLLLFIVGLLHVVRRKTRSHKAAPFILICCTVAMTVACGFATYDAHFPMIELVDDHTVLDFPHYSFDWKGHYYVETARGNRSDIKELKFVGYAEDADMISPFTSKISNYFFGSRRIYALKSDEAFSTLYLVGSNDVEDQRMFERKITEFPV